MLPSFYLNSQTMNVSIFKNVSGTKPIINSEINYVLEKIGSKDTKYYDNIQKARDTKDKEEYKRLKLKTNIPTVTWSGEFYKRSLNDLKRLSQHIYFDIDNVNIDSVSDLINEEPFVKSSWKSLSGEGMGFLVQFDGLTTTNFKTNYSYISEKFAEKDIVLDTLSDYARCNIISYDPDIYINDSPEIVKAIPKPEIVDKVLNYTSEIQNKDLSYKEQCMSVALAYTIKSKGNFVQGNRHHFTVCYAGICNQFGIDSSIAYFFLVERGIGSDVTLKKIQNIYNRYSHQYCTKKLEKKDEK